MLLLEVMGESRICLSGEGPSSVRQSGSAALQDLLGRRVPRLREPKVWEGGLSTKEKKKSDFLE